MKSELIKQFVKKMIRKITVFVVLMIVLTAIGQSISPTITNNIALSQMQNSDASFTLINTYNKIRPIINLASGFIASYFIGNIYRDIYRFAKTMTDEETTEN